MEVQSIHPYRAKPPESFSSRQQLPRRNLALVTTERGLCPSLNNTHKTISSASNNRPPWPPAVAETEIKRMRKARHKPTAPVTLLNECESRAASLLCTGPSPPREILEQTAVTWLMYLFGVKNGFTYTVFAETVIYSIKSSSCPPCQVSSK